MGGGNVWFCLCHLDEDGVQDEEGFVLMVGGNKKQATTTAKEYKGKPLFYVYSNIDKNTDEHAFYHAVHVLEYIHVDTFGNTRLTDKGIEKFLK